MTASVNRINQLYNTTQANKMKLKTTTSLCHCFYCLKTMLPEDIVSYNDEDTAECPVCGCETIVVGQASMDELLDMKTIILFGKRAHETIRVG